MNRTIFNTVKNSKVARFVAQSNKIKASTIKTQNINEHQVIMTKTKTTNTKNPHNKCGKRKFSTFSNFPIPPEDPQSFLWIALALGVSYLIVKKM